MLALRSLGFKKAFIRGLKWFSQLWHNRCSRLETKIIHNRAQGGFGRVAKEDESGSVTAALYGETILPIYQGKGASPCHVSFAIW